MLPNPRSVVTRLPEKIKIPRDELPIAMQPVEPVAVKHLAQLRCVIPQLMELVARRVPHLTPMLLLRI